MLGDTVLVLYCIPKLVHSGIYQNWLQLPKQYRYIKKGDGGEEGGGGGGGRESGNGDDRM